jgi:ketosteroid isomerase-like protein
MRWLTGMLVAASLVIVGPAAQAQTAAVDTRADMQKIATEWMDAYNKKDAGKIAAMYADGAVFSSPGWTATGRAAIEDALIKDLVAGTFSRVTSITAEQSHRVGDLNYASGAWAADTKGPDGKDMPVGGHWLAVSQYRDGHYDILIHNSNMALPPPAK